MEQTHAVFNQAPPLEDYNLYTTDLALQAAAEHGSRDLAQTDLAQGALVRDALTRAGSELGTSANFEHARLANRYPPILHAFDVRGERIDRIEFHPSWHALMQGIAARGYHAAYGTHQARAAGYVMQAQVECGTLCPTTMTYGAIPIIRRDPWLADEWLPHLLTRVYDPRDLPIHAKRGGLIGMGMTEKQGGSDLRANTTRAVRSSDGTYRITGHKWFFSAPQCDAHLVLAQTDGRSSCFLMPRRLPDGMLNGIVIQRLKDKLGNRSNASAEVKFTDAWAHLVGDEGRGIATILEMGTYTRLDCVSGTAGMMRHAVVQALHHARHRKAFGSRLIAAPLMRNVLADLALESEAATALAIRLARAFDGETQHDIGLRRALTSAAKFWVCKRGCELAAEAMEILGGNGYTEELTLARVAREMPVNSIWEGSGNIMCLDVLRAFSRTQLTREAVLAELSAARGLHRHFDSALDRFAVMLEAPSVAEEHARQFVQMFVTLIQASILLGAAATPGASAMAEAFCTTRLDPQAGWGAVFGAGRGISNVDALLSRAWPD